VSTSYTFGIDFAAIPQEQHDRMSMDTNPRLDDFRKHKDEYFASGGHSPLDPADQDGFEGLAYFPYNPALQFELEIDAIEDQGSPLTLDTSDDQKIDFLIAGKVRFLVDNGEYELTLFKDYDRGRYFLPFHDATSGLETYAGGRYLDPQQKPNGKLTVDFNYAYNPYCAYGEGWSCPLPPDQNKLPVELRAGEKAFFPSQR
jgi:uncharacterized protein (DUF1684 family)